MCGPSRKKKKTGITGRDGLKVRRLGVISCCKFRSKKTRTVYGLEAQCNENHKVSSLCHYLRTIVGQDCFITFCQNSTESFSIKKEKSQQTFRIQFYDLWNIYITHYVQNINLKTYIRKEHHYCNSLFLYTDLSQKWVSNMYQ